MQETLAESYKFECVHGVSECINLLEDQYYIAKIKSFDYE